MLIFTGYYLPEREEYYRPLCYASEIFEVRIIVPVVIIGDFTFLDSGNKINQFYVAGTQNGDHIGEVLVDFFYSHWKHNRPILGYGNNYVGSN